MPTEASLLDWGLSFKPRALSKFFLIFLTLSWRLFTALAKSKLPKLFFSTTYLDWIEDIIARGNHLGRNDIPPESKAIKEHDFVHPRFPAHRKPQITFINLQ